MDFFCCSNFYVAAFALYESNDGEGHMKWKNVKEKNIIYRSFLGLI